MDEDRLKRLLKILGVSIIVIMLLKYVLLKTARQASMIHDRHKAAVTAPPPAPPSSVPDIPPQPDAAPTLESPAVSAPAAVPAPVAASTPFTAAEAPTPAP